MSDKEYDDFVYRQDDKPYSQAGKTESRVKSHINAKGEIEPANVTGKTTVQQHIRGSEPVKGESPYTSFSINKPGIGTNKSYGDDIIELDVKKLEQDINTGLVKDVEIFKHEKVVAELQEKINMSKKRYDSNPSKENLKKLKTAEQDLFHASRDKEVLIKGVIPAKYINVKPQKAL